MGRGGKNSNSSKSIPKGESVIWGWTEQAGEGVTQG